LADAQFVLAREYGIKSWAKVHIESAGASPIPEPVFEEFKSAFGIGI
jgi:hypothetical protein